MKKIKLKVKKQQDADLAWVIECKLHVLMRELQSIETLLSDVEYRHKECLRLSNDIQNLLNQNK